MARKKRLDYANFKREGRHLPDYPDVEKAVDPYNGIVYINLDALPGANIIWLFSPYACSTDNSK